MVALVPQVRRAPLVVLTLGGLAVAVAGAGGALAISGGGYTPAKQGCPPHSAAINHADGKQSPKCHDLQVTLHDHAGHTYLQAGTNTTRASRNVHAADVLVSPDGSGSAGGHATGTALRLRLDTHYQPIPPGQCGVFDLLTYPVSLVEGGGCTLDPTAWRLPKQAPTLGHKMKLGKNLVVVPDATGLSLYFGADDGLDSGEHDEPNGHHGTRKSQNGPSDGGAIVLRWHPAHTVSWLSLLLGGVNQKGIAKLAADPLPLLDAGGGGCADGICVAAQSRRQVAYRGGGKAGKHRDVYNYDGKHWDPYDCSGQSVKSEKACHDATHRNEDAFRKDEARTVNLEPGVQLYEDPDPNGSPVLPTYPLPAVYAGTCGIAVGGGPLAFPASPLTNHSGQLVVAPTGC